MKSKKKVQKSKSASVKAKAKVAAPAKAAVKAVKAEATTKTTPFKWQVALYVLFFLAHVAVIALGSSFFPGAIVLGTHLLSPLAALMYSMAVFTLITVAAMPVIEAASKAMNWKLKDMHWMAAYFVINFAALWIVARFAEMLGMGLSSWVVAALLAVIIDVVQGLIVMNLPKDMN